MRLADPLRWTLAALVLASPLALQAAGKCERLVATGTADNPPFVWRDGKRLAGANVELLERIAKNLGLKLEVLHTGDAGKALEEVRSGRIDILLDAPLQAERLAEMDFIHPPIARLESFAWVRNEPGFLYATPADLRGRRGLRVAGDSLSEASGLPDLKPGRDLGQAVAALTRGDADFVLYERYGALARLEQPLLEKIQRLTPAVARRSMHLALSHDSACNDPWLRGQLALQMTELQAAGVPELLLVDNLVRWKEQKPAGEAPAKN
ncbi:substrate-binding periplasmic protein [Pseudomonas oligotrophica]|uniref:substrate-binding periplasmic protein n=1 Tax=Pseudomonas oligotrophica TaxID=2912055 RepID=UPI001F3EA621|nr:transporter substrate-binding domain-containing protein [Pseudomonas oligotrophica]MCF7202736.1 transporter substrate-binding domain-containing protein [Pseudomonas oligotrophica]